MLPRYVKASYYALFSPAMRLNAWRCRQFPGDRNHAKAQLGPGQENYLDDWINVDANIVSSKPDIWADIRYKLPFPDASLDAIYSHHVIEHLPNLDQHFHDMFRCLKPDGLLRVGGPHGDNAIIAMQQERLEWFSDWPTKRRSAGGRFENFIFCKGEHLTILTESFLRELCDDAGFVEVRSVGPGETEHPDTFDQALLDSEPLKDESLPQTLLIEARRPGG